jgi:hypothetical protein
MSRPHNDLVTSSEYTIRQFSDSVDPIELMWHRDAEDRVIESIGETDWKFQLDNELPAYINKPIFIKKYVWHRLIKGSGNLTLMIKK